jgi:two-component system secretion response regulator SsrB
MNIALSDVVICDDHFISLVGIETLLKKLFHHSFNLRQSSRGEEALHLCAIKEPDLLILDLGLPGLSGLDVIKKMSIEFPHCKIIVMTGSDDTTLLNQVLRYKISGLLSKSNSENNLLLALDYIITKQSGTYIDPAILRIIKLDQGMPLTPREFEVLKLMSLGLTSQEIAMKMDCTLSTIKTYRMRIMNKSGARNSSEMMAWFLKKHE